MEASTRDRNTKQNLSLVDTSGSKTSDTPKGKRMSWPLTVVDLFCGAGGLSLGFQQAGWKLLQSIDNNESAVETYRRRFGGHVELADINSKIELKGATVIIGGPPCQGFSSAGLRRSGDNRNTLVSSFAELVAKRLPAAFVFENVEGFLTAEDGVRVFELLTPLVKIGYRVHLQKVNAANFGAILATRTLPLTPTIEEALIGLPTASDELPGRPQGHVIRRLTGKELERAKLLQQGQRMRDLPEELWHESYLRRAKRRVMDGTPTDRRGGPPSGVRRLKADEPSKAITGGVLGEFIHPTEDRSLTVRECARIQTFPDDFEFVGSVAEQSQLIGNAVPPHLARLIATTLAEAIQSASLTYDRGSLLSFIPTLSVGYSPALAKVTEQVRRRFHQAPRTFTQPSLWD
jgi:DNA (cytosine-5)-methyltransferase 1